MKILDNFIKFLKPKKTTLINEDLISLRNQFFKNVNLTILLNFAQYSPDWNDTMTIGKLKLSLNDAEKQKIDDILNKLKKEKSKNNSNYLNFNISDSLSTSGGSILKINWPEKQFGQLVKNLKIKKIKFQPKRNGDEIEFMSNDEQSLKNIFIVWKVMSDGADPTKISILTDTQDLPDAIKSEFESKITRTETKTLHNIVITADYLVLAFIYSYFKLDDIDEFDINDLYSNENEVEILGNNTEILNDFYDSLTILDSISEQMRFIISICYNEMKNNNKNAYNVIQELDKFDIAQQITHYQLRVERAKKSGSNTTYKNIMSVKSLSELKKLLNISEQIKEDYETYWPNPVNACAKRRMKLFADTKHKGAEVIANKNWIMAITITRRQNQVFGRNKPKVDSHGNIIQAANLRTDEGITAENKAIRDSQSYSYIHDKGLPSAAQAQYKETNWCTAGGLASQGNGNWDKTLTDSYYDSYGAIYIVIMDLSNGYMYQYAPKQAEGMFLFESESLSNIGLIKDSYSNYRSNMSYAKKADPLFKQLIDIAYKKIGSQTNTEDYLMFKLKDLKRQGRLTRNNRLIIDLNTDAEIRNSIGILKTFKNDMDFFNGIIINKRTTDNFNLGILPFNIMFSYLPVIDCLNVKYGRQLFSYINVPSLNLINTENIIDGQQMFEYAKINEITGLNTVNMKSIKQMFCNLTAHSAETLPVSIPALNLASCTDISYAFKNSSLRKITLTNTDLITDAIQAYRNCWNLQSFPETKFKSINEFQSLISCIQKDIITEKAIELIFDGCYKLYRHKDFEKICKETYDFYIKDQSKRNTFTNTAKIDERGFLIVSNRNDISNNLNNLIEYPGILVNVENAEQLFSNFNNLNIRILDMSKVKNASQMFYYASISRFDKMINTENIVSASSMFYNARCNIYPELNFPNLSGELTIFADAHPPKEFPRIKVNHKVDFYYDITKSGIQQTIKELKLQNEDDAYNYIAGKVLNRLISSTLSEWKNTFCHGDDAMQRLKDWIIKTVFPTYIQDLENSVNSLTVTKDNFIVVSSKKILDILIFNDRLKDYDGIYIDCHNPKNWFNREYNNLKINVIDMSKVTCADYMFYNAKKISIKKLINTQNIRSANYMFKLSHFDLLPEFDTKYIEDANNMFEHTTYNQEFPYKDFNNVKNAEKMFNHYNYNITIYDASSQSRLKLNLDNFNLKNLENADYMFCLAFVNFKKLNLQKLHNAKYMFYEAHILNNRIKEINLPNAEILNNMFFEAQFSTDTTINKFIAPSASNCLSLFNYSENLKCIGVLNISNASNCENLCNNCRHSQFNILRPIFPMNINCSWSYAFKYTAILYRLYGISGQKIIAKARALTQH